MRGLLYGVSSADPLAFGVVLVVRAAVTFAAALAPARAAARVAPQRALRQD